MKITLPALAFLVTLANPFLAVASTLPKSFQGINEAAAVQTVETYFNTLTTFQAGFTQHTTGDAFTQEGTFTLKKPRQFLWEYTSPNRQRIIGTGTEVYFVDGENGQVTQLPVNAGVNRFFAGKLSLAKEGFKVTAATQTKQGLSATLEPLNAKAARNSQTPQRVVLTFKGNQLSTIQATDALSATTTLTLTNPHIPTNLNNKMFEFTPGQYKER